MSVCDTHADIVFLVNLSAAYVNRQRHGDDTGPRHSVSEEEWILFFCINTHILTPFNSWLITLSLAILCMSKVALEQISEWKGATQSSKPLSIPIKLHCYAFNKGSRRTAVML